MDSLGPLVLIGLPIDGQSFRANVDDLAQSDTVVERAERNLLELAWWRWRGRWWSWTWAWTGTRPWRQWPRPRPNDFGPVIVLAGIVELLAVANKVVDQEF